MKSNSRSDRFLYHLEIYAQKSAEIKPEPITVRNGLVSSTKASRKRVGRRGQDDFKEANYR